MPVPMQRPYWVACHGLLGPPGLNGTLAVAFTSGAGHHFGVRRLVMGPWFPLGLAVSETSNIVSSIPPAKEWLHLKDREKLEKLIRWHYLGIGPVQTLIPHFVVPKGDSGIHLL